MDYLPKNRYFFLNRECGSGLLQDTERQVDTFGKTASRLKSGIIPVFQLAFFKNGSMVTRFGEKSTFPDTSNYLEFHVTDESFRR